MAIKLIDGRMLQADLLRDSVDLSIATDLIYFDVGSNTVNVGTETPIADVQFQIATTGAAMLPKGTTLERPATQVAGMMRFNTDVNGYEYWDGTEWKDVGVVYTAIVDDQFTGTTDTVYTISSADQTDGTVIVSINGVVQTPTTAYTLVGDQLTLSEAPIVTDVIDVRSFRTTTSITELTDGNVSITPNVTQHDIVGHLMPTIDITYDLGSLSNRWRDLYLSGASIDLGGLKLKNVAGTFTVTEADGSTPANFSAVVTDIDGGTY